MADSTEDRLIKALRARGENGMSAEEIAGEFLQAKGAGPKIAAAIVRSMLGKDARVALGQDGRWRAVATQPEAPAAAAAPPPSGVPAGQYTVLEFVMLALPGGEIPIEAAALKVPPVAGRNEAHTTIQLARPLPPATRLPEGLSGEELAEALPLPRVLDGMAIFTRGTTIVSFVKTPLHARVCRGKPGDKECEHVSLKALARRLQLIPADATLKECAEALGIFCPELPRATDAARVSAELLAALGEQAAQKKSAEAAVDLVALQQPQFKRVDFSRYAFDAGFLATMPEAPGVYIMTDANGAPLYVGKAKNLRERVGSYFRPKVQRDEKTEEILERVYDIKVEVVGSELEALLREYDRIRELAPPINTQAEVHERHPSRERPANVILVLPSAAAGEAELFMVRDGRYLIQVSVPRDEPAMADEVVRDIYFSGEPALDESDEKPEAVELLWSWLERHKDEVNRIDLATASGPDEVARLLAAYLREEPHEGRIIHV